MILSLKVQKYNMIDWKQERNLVVTDRAIYNFKGKSKDTLFTTNIEMRRRIEMEKLAGLTMSKHQDSQEIVIHVQGEHDVRLKSVK